MDQPLVGSTLTMSHEGVWLNGERFSRYYFLNPRTGHVRRFVVKDRGILRTAGIGNRVAGVFLACYVNAQERLVLWYWGEEHVVDEHLRVAHQIRWGGCSSTLTIEPAEGPAVHAKQRTFARAILSRLDPGYDGLDES